MTTDIIKFVELLFNRTECALIVERLFNFSLDVSWSNFENFILKDNSCKNIPSDGMKIIVQYLYDHPDLDYLNASTILFLLMKRAYYDNCTDELKDFLNKNYSINCNSFYRYTYKDYLKIFEFVNGYIYDVVEKEEKEKLPSNYSYLQTLLTETDQRLLLATEKYTNSLNKRDNLCSKREELEKYLAALDGELEFLDKDLEEYNLQIQKYKEVMLSIKHLISYLESGN